MIYLLVNANYYSLNIFKNLHFAKNFVLNNKLIQLILLKFHFNM